MDRSIFFKSAEVSSLSETHQSPEPTPAELRDEIRKYLRLLPDIAEPNLARVMEIKEQLKQGNYPTQEIIEETAERIAMRFLRKE